MAQFKKTTNITGKYKAITVVNGTFVDFETGEQVDLADQLFSVYGTEPFSLSTSNKIDVDIE